MTLPDLDWQIAYGRLAWAVALASVALWLWPRAWRLSRTGIAGVLAGSALLSVLPGAASPAYWLGLAVQWPSGLLLGLCVVQLCRAWQGERESAALTPPLAALIALAGGLLYLDAIGLISQGVYYWGFSPRSAPLLSLLLATACVLAAIRGKSRPQALAVFGALVLFAVLRLPTGNYWDALLDPLLWGWALVSLAAVAWRRWTGRQPARPGKATADRVSSHL
jgi:hypothetical protein